VKSLNIVQRCGSEERHHRLTAGAQGLPTFEPVTESKLIATDKNRLDKGTTSPPGMREAVFNKIAGGAPPVHTNPFSSHG
jgi:hypothetical protein